MHNFINIFNVNATLQPVQIIRPMKYLFFATLLLVSSVSLGQHYLRQNEEVVLFFQSHNGKQVYLVRDTVNNYLSYRFGTKNKIEFEYPKSVEDGRNKFTYSYYLRGGGASNEGMDLNYVYFTNNGFRYVVYHTYYAVKNEEKIGVKVIDLKGGKTIDIKGDYKTKKGTLMDFRDNNLLEIGDELFD